MRAARWLGSMTGAASSRVSFWIGAAAVADLYVVSLVVHWSSAAAFRAISSTGHNRPMPS